MTEPTLTWHDLFAKHFEDKIACIRQGLDSVVLADESRRVSRALSSPVVFDECMPPKGGNMRACFYDALPSCSGTMSDSVVKGFCNIIYCSFIQASLNIMRTSLCRSVNAMSVFSFCSRM